MYYSMNYPSPIGPLYVVCKEQGIVGLWMEGQKYFCPIKETIKSDEEHPLLAEARAWLDSYFKGEKPPIRKLQLAPEGSEFRQEVWKMLCEIPYGEVTTYGEIAKQIAAKQGKKSMSAQAVGGAVGHNPISIIIPCHRVVGTDGSLTGYAGGISRKIWLLDYEGMDISRYRIPENGTAL